MKNFTYCIGLFLALFVCSINVQAQCTSTGENCPENLEANTYDASLSNPANENYNRAAAGDTFFLRSNVAEPWAFQTPSYSENMDSAFGAGNWTQEFYETLDVATVFASTTRFVYMEGSDSNASELSAFLMTNIATIENWVSNGGSLLLNAAPNEGGNIDFGFGGTTLTYPNFSSSVVAAAPGHPAFIGPNTPTTTSMTGSSYAHASIAGTGYTNIIVDQGNASQVILAEKAFGNGNVMVGGMTKAGFHSPNPEAINFKVNLLVYLESIATTDSPIITCPSDIQADNTPGMCSAPVFFGDPIAVDPNGGTVTITQTMGPVSGSDFPVGDTIVEFTATNDEAPNETSTCQFVVTVNDIDGPALTCPAAITTDNDMGVCGAVVTYDLPTVTDNCPEDPAGLVQTAGLASGETFPVGTTTNTFVYTDSGGNTATCSFDVTVNDTEAPAAPVCIDMTVNLDANGMVTINANDLTDAANSSVSGLFAIAAFNGGTNDIGRFEYNPSNDDLTLVDNPYASTGVEQIFGFDMNPTTGQVYMITGASSSPTRNLMEYNLDDNTFGADLGTLVSSTGSGNANSIAFSNDGMAYITFSAGGGGGAGATQIDAFDVTTFTSTPLISMPNNGGVGLTYDYDNDQLVYATQAAMGSAPSISAIDIASATVASNFDLTVMGISCSGYSAQAMEYVGNGKVIAGSTFGCAALYTIDLGTQVGNAITNSNGFSTSLKGLLYGAALDNCGSVTITAASGGVAPGSLSTIYEGGNGGATGGAVYFDITVGDADINVSSIDINTGEGGAFTMDVYTEVGTYDGNEANPAFWGTADATASGTGAGANLPSNAVLDAAVTLSANTTYAMALVLDGSHAFDYTNGNGSNETYSNDDITLTLGSATNAPFTDPTFAPRVFNGGINYEFEAAADTSITFDCSNVGENEVTVIATDASGNSNFCTATVTVNDVTAPVLVCQNITVELDENGEATVVAEDLIDSAATFDACGIEVLTMDIDGNFTCDDIGNTFTAQVFASDASNNAATCMAEITVVDMTAPVITCPENQEAEIDQTTGTYTFPDYFAIGEATALDNCTEEGSIVTTQDPAPGFESGVTPNDPVTVTLTSTDASGNTSTCSFEVNVVVEILGVQENELSSAITMYPNPATSQVMIANSSTMSLQKAMIFDISGKMIQTIDLRNMQSEQTINISQLASGIYMVQIASENAMTVKRLIKK